MKTKLLAMMLLGSERDSGRNEFFYRHPDWAARAQGYYVVQQPPPPPPVRFVPREPWAELCVGPGILGVDRKSLRLAGRVLDEAEGRPGNGWRNGR